MFKTHCFAVILQCYRGCAMGDLVLLPRIQDFEEDQLTVIYG